jgi:hypothetical protein
MTRSTQASRPARSDPGGTVNLMPACRIFRFARTSRRASVDSGIRNAAAMSAVSTPHKHRSVSATWACGSSAGWQHMKMSASSSSRDDDPCT